MERKGRLWEGGDSPGLRPVETWANYAPEQGEADQKVLDQLNRVPFGLLVMKAGDHLAMISKGMVYEVHQETADWSRTSFDARTIEKWNWKSAMLVAPPGSEKDEPGPSKAGLHMHAEILKNTTVGNIPSLPTIPTIDPTSSPDDMVNQLMESHLKEGRAHLLDPMQLQSWVANVDPAKRQLALQAVCRMQIWEILQKRAGVDLGPSAPVGLDDHQDSAIDWASGPLPEPVNEVLMDALRDNLTLEGVMEGMVNLLENNPSSVLEQSMRDAERFMAYLLE